MLVHPRPGVDRVNLVEALTHIHQQLANIQGGNREPLTAYLAWANDAVRTLSTQISERDLNRMVLTRRYELLLGAVGHGHDLPAPIRGLLAVELQEQRNRFEAAIQALRDQTNRWSAPGLFIAPDTSFYLHYRHKLRDTNFHQVLDDSDEHRHLVANKVDLRILVPDAVLVELDRLKERSQEVRWRAGHTLGVIDELFRDPNATPELYPVTEGRWEGASVRIELLPDPIGHVRLPDADDEIIDRLVGARSLAGRPITLLTFDTSMSTRARRAELQVLKLPRNIAAKPETPPASGRRQKRDSFTVWLRKQRNEENPVGDLARDASSDPKWPTSGDFIVYRDHMRERGASTPALETLVKAWKLYSGQARDLYEDEDEGV